MKRSQINEIILQGDAFMQSFGFRLPPFAYWSPADMQAKRQRIDDKRQRIDDKRQRIDDKHPHLDGIIKPRLGWDVTDYGNGNFDEMGLLLFTLRNGVTNGGVSREGVTRDRTTNGGVTRDLVTGGICYAEKIMISRKNQISPMHRHIEKTEDIINRGGGALAISMFESDETGGIDAQREVTVVCDGCVRRMAAGDTLLLHPGESVTLTPGNWHQFWGEGGDVLIGEVSSVNNDLTDNVFADPIGRFADIEEDTAPVHLLASDYENWLT